MEGIDPAGRSFQALSDRRKKIKKKGAGKAFFSSLVEENERAVSDPMDKAGFAVSDEQSLEEILDSIHILGDQVKENATYRTIGRYRSAVRTFVRFIIENALEVEERQSSPNILKQKKFTLVKVIDQKLDSLASGILMNQHGNLEILARIDEINGLLVDLIS